MMLACPESHHCSPPWCGEMVTVGAGGGVEVVWEGAFTAARASAANPQTSLCRGRRSVGRARRAGNMGYFNRIAAGATCCIWIDRVQFALGCLCVDMDRVFGGYMRSYA